jgi:hypothetical protein
VLLLGDENIEVRVMADTLLDYALALMKLVMTKAKVILQ